MRSRSEVVKKARSWLGKNESDGSYKMIIDIYNSFEKLPRGIKMRYDWSWCACTWSAIAISLGYTDIMPIEISCGELIKKAQKMGIWKESDDYKALPGDAILYDWDDNGIGDNNGWPDHIGVIEKISNGIYTVIEGNKNNAVGRRTIKINGRYIRGFITPKYTDDKKAENTTSTEKEDADSQTETAYAKYKDKKLSGTYLATADLNCRTDAGTSNKVLCTIPKGTKVKNYGYYNKEKNIKWLLVEAAVNKKKYVGFSSEKYLKKI